LIELVVVIGLLGTLLTATSTTLHQVIRAEIAARHASDRLSALSRAALAFRTDVHAARQLTISDEGKSLTCQLADGAQVAYVVGPQSVTRAVTATGQPPRRETFRLLGGTAKFQHGDREGLAVYSLVWQLPTAAVTPGLASDVMSVPIEAVPRLMIAGR
jgi:type II secretory pathway pseudopilin PulG